MAKFSRIEVALQMKESGLVPVFYHSDIETCIAVVKACYAGGIRVFEFTNRADQADTVFDALLTFVRKELPALKLGVGSIVDAPTAAMYIQKGADFIVSPILNQDIAKVCNRRKVLWSPGCGSLSEISQAEEWGAEVVKIFPAKQVGGPDFIKAIKGPMPWSNIMPTGGVFPTKEDLTQWFAAGAYCVGLGSQLITKPMVKQKDFAGLQHKVEEIVAIVEQLRSM